MRMSIPTDAARRAVLFAATCFLAALTTAQAHPPLGELGVDEARRLLASGEIGSVDLTRHYLERIAVLDDAGPHLNAIIDTNPEALADAARLDRERRAGHIRSPLHGLPVVLKANIATADSLPTTAGSLALAGFTAGRDAAFVARLREAGVVILAKANLSEWANFRGRRSVSGWSSLGGQTVNPYVLDRNPCGSSSGSGVAVSADLTLLAVGTETDGSIVCPAAVNGIAGIKPTHGAVSTDGIIPLATSQDIAGPLARSVADAAALLQAMLTPKAAKRLGADLEAAARSSDLAGRRLGVVTAFNDEFPWLAALMDDVTARLEAAGAATVEIEEWQLDEQVYEDELFVLTYEFRRDLENWFADFAYPNGLRTMADLAAFNDRNAAAVMPIFGQEYVLAAVALDLTGEENHWREARERSRRAARRLIDQTLQKHDLAAILLPAYAPAWPLDYLNGDRVGFGNSSAGAIAGYPQVAFPGGFRGELPVGLLLVGGAWQDRDVIALASAAERLLAARRPPRWLKSLERSPSS